MRMNTGRLIRDARHAAGLTQAELAKRAMTTQPAVAAYERGARIPTLSTLRRLLEACDHDLQLLAHPRMRRGAASLEQLAPAIEQELAAAWLQAGRFQTTIRSCSSA